MRYCLLSPVLAAAMLTACTGGNLPDTADTSTSIEGIYSGTISYPGATYNLVGLVDANGEARLVESNQNTNIAFAVVDPSAPISPVNGTFESSGDVYSTSSSQELDNGKTSEVFSFSGTITPGQSIAGTSTDSAGNEGTISANYVIGATTIPAALTTVAGEYTFTYSSGAIQTATVTISQSGQITGSDTANCIYSGTATIPDPAANLYEVTLSDSCTASGISGLAFYIPSDGSTSSSIVLAANDSTIGFYLTLEQAQQSGR